MARWITVHANAVPFDYRWPGVNAITAVTAAGEMFVKDGLADYAVAKGFADEGKLEGSTARSTKGGTRPRNRRKVRRNAAAADQRTDSGMDAAHPVDDGAAGAGGAVDPPGGER
jgi:hypothetical protein